MTDTTNFPVITILISKEEVSITTIDKPSFIIYHENNYFILSHVLNIVEEALRESLSTSESLDYRVLVLPIALVPMSERRRRRT